VRTVAHRASDFANHIAIHGCDCVCTFTFAFSAISIDI
jgi:hypothetical protein